MSEATREAFEAHLRSLPGFTPSELSKTNGEYADPHTAAVWIGWQAALSGAQQWEEEPVAGLVQVTSECFKQVLPWDEAKRQHAAILSASETLGSPGEGAELIPLYTAPQPAQVPDMASVNDAIRKAYNMGWIKASEWGGCDDLVSDMDSPAFEEERAGALDFVHGVLTAAPSGDAKPVPDDSELPGMWSQSDLSGGATDCAPKHHTLKTDPAVFDRSAMGRKPWEIRLNDRDFQVGDTVTLQETKHSGAEMRNGAPLDFTGTELNGQITYVLRGPKYGLADGWCIFSVDYGDAKREALPPIPYSQHEKECGKLIDERDHAQDWADKLAGAIGEHFGIDIGDHSSCNCPWETAFDTMPNSKRQVIPPHMLASCLYESARCLGVAQAKDDKPAIDHWTEETETLLSRCLRNDDAKREAERKTTLSVLESWADHLDELSGNALDNGHPEHSEAMADAAGEMRDEIARLRQSDSDDDSEEETHE